ncbi:MAG: hypothetical protein F6K19_08245 [Cyanothece sp. SIO1E1]|nr:hypothetical protein [Cyanothece sp. SIO1E1]
MRLQSQKPTSALPHDTYEAALHNYTCPGMWANSPAEWTAMTREEILATAPNADANVRSTSSRGVVYIGFAASLLLLSLATLTWHPGTMPEAVTTMEHETVDERVN